MSISKTAVVPTQAAEPGAEDNNHRGSWLDEKIAAVEESEPCMEEPSTKMQKFVRSNTFTLATTLLICVNGILIGFETDGHGDPLGWQIVEVIFLVLYSIELALRLYAEGCVKSLKNDGWVRFDAIVMFVALADMIIITPVMESSGGGGGEAKQIAMVLRILRLMKLARLVRLLRFFKELWLLVASMGSAMRTLGWTFFLLTIVIYVFAILFVKMIGKETEEEDLQLWFGTIGSAMFTLFQMMTLEDWASISRVIWTTDRKFMLFVVLLYIAITSFAIMNTVMAVIVEHTLDQAMDQKAELIKKAEEELKQRTETLLEIFMDFDADGGGTLSKDEFITALDSQETRKLLAAMDLGDDIGTLQPEEIGMLFDMIDIDRNMELSPQEFVNGIMQMRGAARARRVFELQCSIAKTEKQTHKQVNQIESMVRRLNGKEPIDEEMTPTHVVEHATHLAELEGRLDAGLAENTKMLSDLEAKLDLGLASVNKHINALVSVLPRPAG